MKHGVGFESPGKVMGWCRELFLTAAALLGVLCLTAATATTVFDVTPLVFRSGSMAPTIQTGALALSRTVPAAELRTGDIVSVPTSTGVRVTHRVQAVDLQDGLARLELKGDANPVPDAEPYLVRSAERVYLDVPYLGYAVAAASGRTATFAGGLLVGLALLLAFARRPGPAGGASVETCPVTATRNGGRHRAGRRRRHRSIRRWGTSASAVSLVALGVLVAGHAHVPEPTLAAWTDSAATTSGDLKADTVLPTTSACADGLLAAATFTWTAVTGATSYTVHYGAGGASTVTIPAANPRSYTVTSGTGTAWVVANRAFGATTWSSVASNAFTYVFASVLFIGLVSTCTAV